MKAILIGILLCHAAYGDFSSDDLHASFWANYSGYNKDFGTAFAWYKKYLCRQNLPGYMYRGLLHLFKQTNNTKQIISLMPLIEKDFEDDIEIQMIFVDALQQTGKEEDADTRICALISKIPDNQELTFHAAQTFIRHKEPENALKTIDDYLSHASGRLNNFIFYFLKAQIYVMLNKKNEALTELQQALDIHPAFDKGWLLFALLQEQTGAIKKAIKGYRNFLEVSNKPIPHVQEHLLRLLFKQKLLEAQAKNVSVNMSYFEQALLLFRENKYSQALEKINKSLSEEPRNKDGKILKTHILNALDKPDQALDYICYWMEHDTDTDLWFELAHLTACQYHLENQLIRRLRTVQHNHPHLLNAALYLADLYTRTEQKHNAVAQHIKAYNLAKDTTTRAHILTHLAIIYYDYEMLDKMPDLIALAENLQHSFAPLYNTIAYWYATEGKNLSRAQELIDKALAQETLNPFFLDTQAMIYYKSKDYDRAQSLFETASVLLPEESSILKYKAKCALKLNNQQFKQSETISMAAVQK